MQTRTFDGIFRDGVITLIEPVRFVDGQPVKITVTEETVVLEMPGDNVEPGEIVAQPEEGPREKLLRITKELAFDFGVADLADNYDHYLYGTPTRKEKPDGDNNAQR